MNLKNVVKIPYNDRPAERRATSATITVLPVIRIERFDDDEPENRIMNLRTMRRE